MSLVYSIRVICVVFVLKFNHDPIRIVDNNHSFLLITYTRHSSRAWYRIQETTRVYMIDLFIVMVMEAREFDAKSSLIAYLIPYISG